MLRLSLEVRLVYFKHKGNTEKSRIIFRNMEIKSNLLSRHISFKKNKNNNNKTKDLFLLYQHECYVSTWKLAVLFLQRILPKRVVLLNPCGNQWLTREHMCALMMYTQNRMTV